MDPPSDEPSTPKLMSKTQTQLVRRKNPLGVMTQYVEITDQFGAKTYHELTPAKQKFQVEQTHRRWRRFSLGTLWKSTQLSRWTFLMMKILIQQLIDEEENWHHDSRGHLVPKKPLLTQAPMGNPSGSSSSTAPARRRPEMLRVWPPQPSENRLRTPTAPPGPTASAPRFIAGPKQTAFERKSAREDLARSVLNFPDGPVMYFRDMSESEIITKLGEMTVNGGLKPLAKQLSVSTSGTKPELVTRITTRIQTTLSFVPSRRPDSSASSAAPTTTRSSGARAVPKPSPVQAMRPMPCSAPMCLVQRGIYRGDLIANHEQYGTCHYVCMQAILQADEVVATSTA